MGVARDEVAGFGRGATDCGVVCIEDVHAVAVAFGRGGVRGAGAEEVPFDPVSRTAG
jgi:hypothetical protein